MIDRKEINIVETNNFIVEPNSSLNINDVLSEVKKCINNEGTTYFSREYFFFNSSKITEYNLLDLEEVQYTQQIFTIFFHNIVELYRYVLSDKINYFELQDKKIYFIFVFPSFDLSDFKLDPRYNHFNHISIAASEEIEVVDAFFELKPSVNLVGFDLFEKSGFSQTSDHFKLEYISKNNYNKETIKKLAFFGIISPELSDFLLIKISSEETYVDKISSGLHSIKTFFLTIF